MELKGKVALISGGGSGIGLAIARGLTKEGVHTILASRRYDLVSKRAKELSSSTKSIAIEVDIRSKSSIERAMERVWSEFSTVDILINNSGVGTDALAVDLAESEWDRVIETNLKGAFLLSQAVLPKMIANRRGHIINISSQAGKHGYANATAYCASKFGLIGFGLALQEEVRSHNIKVNNLLPALVQVPPPEESGQVRQGVLQVEDLAETVVFLCKQPERVKIEDIGLYNFA
ncbi:MAG: SDR family NAD(P)-dependent oxidoreductase [Blastocatellia bacterium]|nr:SDR family NAD(P)-dependent oxidoreductase [Blastocatellia bacterium]